MTEKGNYGREGKEDKKKRENLACKIFHKKEKMFGGKRGK